MKKEIVIFVFGVFLLSFASALSFSDKTILSDTIIKEFNQPAHFQVALTGVESGDYELYTLTDVSLGPKGVFSLPGGSASIDVYVFKTPELKEEGYYTFGYYLKKIGGDNYPDKMTIRVVSLANALEIGSDTIIPDSDKITFYVQNKENTELDNIKVHFNSIFFDFDKEITLKPYQKVQLEVPVDKQLLKTTKAGSYIVKADFATDAGEKRVEGKIYLGEKKDIRTEQDTTGFLIYTTMITKMNTGNVVQDVSVVIQKNILTRLFTSFNSEPDGVQRTGFGIVYTWNKQLDPAEVFTVKSKTNYLFPVFIILFAAIVIFVFKRYTETKIEVRKSVSPVRAKGGELALRVTVKVKARRNVENVSLIDKLPALVKVYESFGVLKPTKVDEGNRRIHWNLGGMQAGEERIVSYIIYSKVGVVGRFSLPSALTVFEKDDKIHEVESNNVFFFAEQAKKDF